MAVIGGIEATRARLAAVTGQPEVMVGKEAAPYSAAGEQPVAVVLPENEAQMVEVARVARADGVPVVTWGGGSKQDMEPVQTRNGIVLGTSRLNAIQELDVANLTVTVSAGMVLDELQRELAREKMFLALDPVDSATSTVGGMLATNSSGPNRLLYRTARDIVLGMRVVTPLGEAVKAGGKTVKDVAGYDMKKLYIGSWGTLGCITEATFRTLPLPEASATVAMVFPELASASATVMALLGSFMRPSSADLISQGAMPEADAAYGLRAGEYLLLVQFEGAVEAVERQKREMSELASNSGVKSTAILEGEREQQCWQQRKAALAPEAQEGPSILIKGSVLLNRVQDYVRGVSGLGTRAKVAAHAGNGVVYARVAGDESALVAAAGQAQRLAAGCGGFAMVLRAPRAVSEKVRIWPPRSDYGLMRAIKEQLDPGNLWNPARIPGGSR